MACDSMADLYFPESQAICSEGLGGDGKEAWQERGTSLDLTAEGFIPIHKLTLAHLPEPIRTEESLQLILDFSTRVVRINNNGLSDQRPNDDEFTRRNQRTLQASGYMFHAEKEGIHIVTNRHVLFNEEELRRSTFDVFYDNCRGDPDDNKHWQRSRRGDARFSVGQCSKYDLIRTVYKVKEPMKTHIKEHCPKLQERPKHIARTCNQTSKNDPKQRPIVCLISHPLAQPKHVCFGEMIRVQRQTLYHNAPTKPGCSGGPIIVFPNRDDVFLEPFLMYHVGTDMKTGHKFAHVDSLDLSLVDAREYLFPRRGNLESPTETPGTQEVFGKAGASLEITSLAALTPLFAAFLVHAREAPLDVLDTSLLKPCRATVVDGLLSSKPEQHHVLKTMGKIAQVAPCFAKCNGGEAEDGFDIMSALESQGPCFCQSIVRMMDTGITAEDGAVAESFLSPYTAAAKMSTDVDVTWPWLNRGKHDVKDDKEEDECLLKKCLSICDHHEGTAVPAILILMIMKANSSIRWMFPSICVDCKKSASVGKENPWETINTRAQEKHSCVHHRGRRPMDDCASFHPRKEETFTDDLEDDCPLLIRDVLLLVYSCLSLFCGPSALPSLDTRPEVNAKPTEEENNFSTKFHRCRARSEHAVQHERQRHPDTKRSLDRDNKESWCQCGRPTQWEAMKALKVLLSFVELKTTSKGHRKHIDPLVISNIVDADADIAGFFYAFFLAIKEAAMTAMPRAAEKMIMDFLDKASVSTRGRHSLTLYLAAGEALLYNCCLLARLISKNLQPLYFAFPVSVFGRPGNWPGNVTPPEVQRAAWRQIQDAIKASGFRPALLAALEKDAERRSKLIDVYVDMKQLKWEGKIQPHLFGSALASFRTPNRVHFMSQEVPFQDATAFFVWCVGFLVCPQSVGF